MKTKIQSTKPSNAQRITKMGIAHMEWDATFYIIINKPQLKNVRRKQWEGLMVY